MRLFSLLVVVAGHTLGLGVNSGANSAPINQLIRAPSRRPKSCYISTLSTARARSRSNFEQGSAKYEKGERYLKAEIVIYTSATARKGGAKDGAEPAQLPAGLCRSPTVVVRNWACGGRWWAVVAHAGPRCQQIIPPPGNIKRQSTDAMGQTFDVMHRPR